MPTRPIIILTATTLVSFVGAIVVYSEHMAMDGIFNFGPTVWGRYLQDLWIASPIAETGYILLLAGPVALAAAERFERWLPITAIFPFTIVMLVRAWQLNLCCYSVPRTDMLLIGYLLACALCWATAFYLAMAALLRRRAA